MLADHFNEGHWKIIFYGKLNEFVEEYKRKHYTIADFDTIANIKPASAQVTDSGQLKMQV